MSKKKVVKRYTVADELPQQIARLGGERLVRFVNDLMTGMGARYGHAYPDSFQLSSELRDLLQKEGPLNFEDALMAACHIAGGERARTIYARFGGSPNSQPTVDSDSIVIGCWSEG